MEVDNVSKKPVNWWNIITKISHDKSTWDYLEPAEIVEILQRVTEAKERIAGLDQYIRIYLSPALQKLQYLMDPWYNPNIQSNTNTPNNHF
jgi:hypothetical protein